MSTAMELIRAVEANGGQMQVEGDCLVIAPEDAATPLLDALRRHKVKSLVFCKVAALRPQIPR